MTDTCYVCGSTQSGWLRREAVLNCCSKHEVKVCSSCYLAASSDGGCPGGWELSPAVKQAMIEELVKIEMILR